MGKFQDGGKLEYLFLKSKMAAQVKFAEALRPALQRAKSNCLSQISRGDGIKKVNDFFGELDRAVGVLEDKFSQRSRDSNIQRLLPARGMVAKALRKIHAKIIHRLNSRPKLANPWLGEFTVDMPMEVSQKISWTEQILGMNLVKRTPNCYTKSTISERPNTCSRGWTLTVLKQT